VKQRFRWTFGTLQVAWKHRGAALGRPSGVSLVTLPNIVLFQFGFTLLAPVVDALLLFSVAQATLASGSSAGAAQADTLLVLASYWALFQALDAMAVATAIALDGCRSSWRLMPLIVLQRFTYRQVLYWVAIRALLAALKGTFVGWGKLVRTGHVALPSRVST
jgi:hypothetical protein